MPYFRCSLGRTFLVEVKAKNKDDAAQATESFIGYFDESTPADQARYGVKMLHIEMVYNDVVEVRRIKKKGLKIPL